MDKKESMTGRTGNIIATIYFFLSGFFTLNFLGDSIVAQASGIVFLIAAVYGVVCISKDAKYIV